MNEVIRFCCDGELEELAKRQEILVRYGSESYKPVAELEDNGRVARWVIGKIRERFIPKKPAGEGEES